MEKLWRNKEEYQALVKEAKETDLLAYLLTYEPNMVTKEGGVYKHRMHDSLVYMNRGGYWYWYSRGRVVNALDYMTDPELGGMSFTDAVAALTKGIIRSDGYKEKLIEIRQVERQPKEFKLPYPRKYATRLSDYLSERGIHLKVIQRCQRLGIVYETMHYGSREAFEKKEGVLCAVFVGYEGGGKERYARFAQKRSMEGGEVVKRDVAGSDKRFSFVYPPKEAGSKTVAVFEAPIDALSHASLQEMDRWKWNGWRLSLSGTSPVALISFLVRHPEIKKVDLYLDNDQAGILGAENIKTALKENNRFSSISVRIHSVRGGKDYNEALTQRIEDKRLKTLAQDVARPAPEAKLPAAPGEKTPAFSLRRGILKSKVRGETR